MGFSGSELNLRSISQGSSPIGKGLFHKASIKEFN